MTWNWLVSNIGANYPDAFCQRTVGSGWIMFSLCALETGMKG